MFISPDDIDDGIEGTNKVYKYLSKMHCSEIVKLNIVMNLYVRMALKNGLPPLSVAKLNHSIMQAYAEEYEDIHE